MIARVGGLLALLAGCVDKAPPPLWPAPPPPSIATPIGVDAPKPIVTAPAKPGEAEGSVLDPETAAAGSPQPPPARPVPTHK